MTIRDEIIGQTFRYAYTGEICTVVAATLTRVQLRYPDGGTRDTTREALHIHWEQVSRTPRDTAEWARITRDAKQFDAPHLTFAEQIDAGHPDPMPCACWHAGHGDIREVDRPMVMHAAAYAEGAECAFEQAYDL